MTVHVTTVTPKVGLVFLGRRRGGFDSDWGQRMTERARGAVGALDFDVWEPAKKVVDDQSLRQALAECDEAGVQVVVCLQTTMADARLTQTFAQLWPHPILLWATPENPEGDMVSSCSLVGAHCWASILRQMRHPFEVVYGDPDDGWVQIRLTEAVRLAYTVRRLQSARIGVIGGQAPGYFAMSADPLTVKQALGAQVQTFSLSEFVDRVNESPPEEVEADVDRVKDSALPHKDTTDDDLPVASRLYLALQHYFTEEGCDAVALRDWPELPRTVGQWPYLAICRLAEEGLPVACEGDADGALTGYLGACLDMGPCFLSDWLEHDEQTVTLWHGGVLPFSLSPEQGQPGAPHLARHFNFPKPLVVESTLKPGMPVTLCRLWRVDGCYQLTTCDAEALPPRRTRMGSSGLVRLNERDPLTWFDTLCHEGMPHHVAVFRGHHTPLLRRFARMAGIRLVE